MANRIYMGNRDQNTMRFTPRVWIGRDGKQRYSFTVKDARIKFASFTGKTNTYGQPEFHLILTKEAADFLKTAGFRINTYVPSSPDSEPEYSTKIVVYSQRHPERFPKIVVHSMIDGKITDRALTLETLDMLDDDKVELYKIWLSIGGNINEKDGTLKGYVNEMHCMLRQTNTGMSDEYNSEMYNEADSDDVPW